jgi:hypothetical protein
MDWQHASISIKGAAFMLARRHSGTATLRFLISIATLVLSCVPHVVQAQGLPLTIAASFSPSTVVVGGTATTTMTVTVTNPNGFSVSGISFSDTYPAGLVVDQIGAYTCAAGSAVFTGSGWSMGSVTLGAGASCNVPIRMHSTIVGPVTNVTSQVTGTGVPPGGPASAVLNVTAIPAPAVPALSEWMLIVLAIGIATICVVSIRNRTGHVSST